MTNDLNLLILLLYLLTGVGFFLCLSILITHKEKIALIETKVELLHEVIKEKEPKT